MSNELTCPHCGSSGGLMKTPNGEWMCLDCYWQEGETTPPNDPLYVPQDAAVRPQEPRRDDASGWDESW